MSIIETSLNKIKAADQAGGREVRVADRRIEALADAAVAAELDVRKHFFSPIDLDSIRRQGMLPPEEDARALADEFRRVKWPLIAAATGKSGAARVERGNLLLTTSALPGEGKSFVSMNLALSVALERDSRVLLIDADPAKARISRLCGLGDRPGLTDLLSDEQLSVDDVIVETDVPGLQVIPAGRTDVRSPELFASRRAERLLHDIAARNAGRMVILDSPPLLATNEAQVLSRLVGQVLLVVRADSTPRSALVEAAALLDPGRKVSCLLNQVRTGMFGEGYSQYYHAERDQ